MELFGGGQPKMPAPPKIPKPPTLDAAAEASDQANLIRRRRGIASDMLTGSGGALTPAANVGTKTLLGQ